MSSIRTSCYQYVRHISSILRCQCEYHTIRTVHILHSVGAYTHTHTHTHTKDDTSTENNNTKIMIKTRRNAETGGMSKKVEHIYVLLFTVCVHSMQDTKR